MSKCTTALALLIAALFATSTQAASQIDQVQLICSDTLSIEGTSALSMRCTGDFTLAGQNTQGTITADESLSIWAAGRLSFQDVLLTAPSITLGSDTQVLLDSHTQIKGATMAIHGDLRAIVGDSIVLPGGRDVIPGAGEVALGGTSPVPEPNGAVLGLSALMLCGLQRLTRSRSR